MTNNAVLATYLQALHDVKTQSGFSWAIVCPKSP